MRAILAGGPKHGDIIEVATKRDLVFAVNFPAGPLLIPGEPVRPRKPGWKKYIFRYYEWARAYDAWKYWKPVDFIFKDVTFEQVVYRIKWHNAGTNEAIYWYEGTATAPFETANEIFHYLYDRMAEIQRSNYGNLGGYHWEMGSDWFAAIWNATLNRPSAMSMERRGDDMLLGIPVKVTGPAGAPRIVKDERVEAIR